ncbi:DUF3944 domain-containing protein [Gilliamella apicola]|uniref:DUF3944 domain-containing protein n=1 Tax=Gilliamella apicola TaxID=1196095 RepID=UPI0021B196B3|nr:DUF3944 domain-containing protein [Gilliamella apicola]
MAVYRSDPDLVFLKECANEDLKLLVDVLTIDPKDKCARYTETLISDSEYKKYYPNPKAYWQSIAAELQAYGGSTITNIMRRNKGVLYCEILMDVCSKVKANINKLDSVSLIENALLMKILEKSLANMKQDELEKLAQELGEKNTSVITASKFVVLLQTNIAANPFLWSLIITLLLQRLGFNIGQVVLTTTGTFVAPWILPFIGVLAGPIGFTLSGLWLAIGYRSTCLSSYCAFLSLCSSTKTKIQFG